jgi:hypothetical protein
MRRYQTIPQEKRKMLMSMNISMIVFLKFEKKI